MKKVFALIVTVALVASMFASLSISAANDPIVFDFSKDGNYKAISSNETSGENWVISLPGGVNFMGKNSKQRIAYEYDAAEGATKFTAHVNASGQVDPYFISSDAEGNGAELPAAYQIDTSVYKYMKISYKKTSDAVTQGVLWFLPTGANGGGYATSATETFIYPLGATGEWATEVVAIDDLNPYGVADTSAVTNWSNISKVAQIRLNPFSSLAKDGDEMWIEYIAFFASADEANAFELKTEEPEQPGTEEPGTQEPAGIVDWADYGKGKSLSWDSMSVNTAKNYIDGIENGAPNLVKWLSEHDNTVDGSDSSISKLILVGWVGLDQKVVKIGYSVDGGAPVWDASEGALNYEVSDPVKAAGGDNAVGYTLSIDVSQISGKHDITAVVELEDGTVVALTIAAQPMVFTYQGPGQKEPQPEIPATSDATGAVFMIAAAAVVVTVLLKKKVMG